MALTKKQKKLPMALQKAILKKQKKMLDLLYDRGRRPRGSAPLQALGRHETCVGKIS